MGRRAGRCNLLQLRAKYWPESIAISFFVVVSDMMTGCEQERESRRRRPDPNPGRFGTSAGPVSQRPACPQNFWPAE